MKAPFAIYLNEIKWRSFYILLSLSISFIIAFYKKSFILICLTYPLLKSQQKLIATEVGEILLTYLSICANLSALLCFPLVVYHVFTFVSNGWYFKEKNTFKIKISASTLFFSIGFCYTYFYILPLTWNFFSQFQILDTNIGLNLENEIRISSYVNWTFTTLFLSAYLTSIPLWLFIYINKPLKIKTLKHTRKYFILLSIILGTLLSPPEVISQLMIAGWIIFNYELLIFYTLNIKLRKDFEKRYKTHYIG